MPADQLALKDALYAILYEKFADQVTAKELLDRLNGNADERQATPDQQLGSPAALAAIERVKAQMAQTLTGKRKGLAGPQTWLTRRGGHQRQEPSRPGAETSRIKRL